jgi:hypothetical protein
MKSAPPVVGSVIGFKLAVGRSWRAQATGAYAHITRRPFPPSAPNRRGGALVRLGSANPDRVVPGRAPGPVAVSILQP